MHPTKVLPKGRTNYQKKSNPTITPTKPMVFQRLKRTLLFTLGVKANGKFNIKAVNESKPSMIEVKKKIYIKYSASRVDMTKE